MKTLMKGLHRVKKMKMIKLKRSRNLLSRSQINSKPSKLVMLMMKIKKRVTRVKKVKSRRKSSEVLNREVLTVTTRMKISCPSLRSAICHPTRRGSPLRLKGSPFSKIFNLLMRNRLK
jgi:hypothetical protein